MRAMILAPLPELTVDELRANVALDRERLAVAVASGCTMNVLFYGSSVRLGEAALRRRESMAQESGMRVTVTALPVVTAAPRKLTVVGVAPQRRAG